MRTKTVLCLLAGILAMLECAGFEALENASAFRAAAREHLSVGADGLLRLDSGSLEGSMTSRVIDLGEGNSLRFLGWVNAPVPLSAVAVEYRTTVSPFAADAPVPAWREAQNSRPVPADGNRYCQYRVRMSRKELSSEPFLRELFLSTKTLNEKYKEAGSAPKTIPDLTMMMLYSVTPEKLYHVYSQLPYDASERGLYVFRNAPGRRIGDGYRYEPGDNEMYLPMRYGTRILARFHPVATFSDRSMRPADVILRAKDGREKIGPREQHRTVNFFDREFLAEYRTGLRAAVNYYKENNPYVFGYTLMIPEFFYDTEPWPQMTYLSGFSPEAFASYREFMRKLGRDAKTWPAPSDGDILLDPDTYLWSYWRSRAGADYIASLARTIREADPEAQVGTMHYVSALGMRGLEPGFVELNPDFDFYYSSNLYPRVPGKDGLDNGTAFSYTRLNVEGHSRKLNLLEYDLWSPYVDAKRAKTYARYAALEGVVPVPIVLGDFPDNKPSNHLTRYHGMKGSSVNPECLKTLAENVNEVRGLHSSEKFSEVALILPSISLQALLEKDRWLPHRLVQQGLHILKPLLELNVAFDFLTEGCVTKEQLDRYKLVIVDQPAVYPWMREALAGTKADILALGWAGTVAAPGPKALLAPIEPGAFDFTLTHAWPREAAGRGTTLFPTGGKVVERESRFRFSGAGHPLTAGLGGVELAYAAPGLAGKPLPYVAGMKGELLASDSAGNAVYTVLRDGGRKIIHFGGLPYQLNADGSEKRLFTPTQETRFFRNLMDFCGIEFYPDAGPLRMMRNGQWLLVENTSPDKPYSGPLPKAVHPKAKLPEHPVNIAPLDSILLPL